jgi:2,4-dienoyl-CoA reductase-like NADH-dependent reductase (Old Yellow Enzyme family)
MSLLFSPHALGSLTLKNRIVIAPMCQYSADNGNASDWHLMHLGQMAMSGAGLLILEATAVSPEGRITPQDLGLWSDDNEVALTRVVASVKRWANPSQMPLAIQLGHAGRKASSEVPWRGGQLLSPEQGGWVPVGPSALPHLPEEPAPLALDRQQMDRIKADFVKAALRAQRVGLEAIELHAAHGYLLHQFLSPLANQRSDEYGGSLSNRMRFPLEVFEAVRQALPEKMPVGVRLSAVDWVEGGLDLAQTTEFGLALKARGAAFLHVSSAGVSPLQKIPLGPGYQVDLAAHLKREVGLPTMAVGLITEAQQAEAVLAQGQADFVALARGMLFDPRWPWHAAAELGAQVQVPEPYWRSQPRHLKDLFGSIVMGQR